ncbi:MAG: hypothetical protein Fur0022_06180 [Anaerolineales bacterium]
MAETYGLTAETYRAVTAIIDDRVQYLTVTRREFDRIAEGQARLETRMDRVEIALANLAEAQTRTEQRVEELAQAQARTEQRLQSIEDAIQHLTQGLEETRKSIDRLAEIVEKHEKRLGTTENHVAQLRGDMLEMQFRDRAATFWGKVMRKVKAFYPGDLEDELEARLSEEDYAEILLADLLVRGQPRLSKVPELWLVLEVSATTDRQDVERAIHRAEVLRKAGYTAIPAVAGEKATEGAQDLASEKNVVINLKGQLIFWDLAVEFLRN